MIEKFTQIPIDHLIGLIIFACFFSAPFCLAGQAGNTITFVATPNCANPTPITLTYAGTDATGRHQYEHAANPTVSCAWNDAQSRWEFYHPGVGLGAPFTHSTFTSTPNPPDKVTGNYQTGGYFGLDCIGDGSDASFNITGSGTQNVLSLPITLHSFTGKGNQSHILLQWQTDSELNNDYMAIERSADGRQFQEIGRLDGAGTTNEMQNYSFSDHSPSLGINYYRLRQVDFDGKTTYHDVITVDYRLEGINVRVVPNPVTDVVNIQLADNFDTPLDVVVYNLYGQAIIKHTLAAGANQIELDLSHLKIGHYILELNNNGTSLLQERMVKK